jgi:hypothetical protein
MVHRYIQYNGHMLTIWVSFIVNVCVCGGGGAALDPRSDLVVPLVLRTACCVMIGAPALYYRSLGTASILLRRDNISDRLYC